MKTAGLSTCVEAKNSFRGKVPSANHDAYVQHFLRENLRHGIIPDILVQNYPKDDVDSLFTTTARTKEAIFEIKGIRVSPNNYPISRRATDRRAAQIPTEYRNKARAIDLRLAPHSAATIGPFQRALRTFATGGPIPLCIGGFGETNEKFDETIHMLSTLAAQTKYGRNLTPAGSTRDSSTLLRVEFRRALGVQFVKANARLKLERLHLVGSTKEEARSLAAQHKSKRRWNPNTDCPSWFSANYSRGNYQAWYESRQSYHHFRPH